MLLSQMCRKSLAELDVLGSSLLRGAIWWLLGNMSRHGHFYLISLRSLSGFFHQTTTTTITLPIYM